MRCPGSAGTVGSAGQRADRGRLAARLAERGARMAIAALRARAAACSRRGGGGRVARADGAPARARARLEDALDAERRSAPASSRCSLPRRRSPIWNANATRGTSTNAGDAVAPLAGWQRLQQLRPTPNGWRGSSACRPTRQSGTRADRALRTAEKGRAQPAVKWAVDQRTRELKTNGSDPARQRPGRCRDCAPSCRSIARGCCSSGDARAPAELERTLAAGLRRLGRGWDVERVARSISARASRRAAALAGAAARTSRRHADAKPRWKARRGRVRDLCRRSASNWPARRRTVTRRLDGRWRALWTLRAHMEEIWDVQSRAEANART